MATANAKRRVVISGELHLRLTEYLQFRHVFRQAYSFQLRWEKMEALVWDSEQTLTELEGQLRKWMAERAGD